MEARSGRVLLSAVGRSTSQVDPWDHLLNSLYEDLDDHDKERILVYYSHDNNNTEAEEQGMPLTQERFSAVINGVHTDHLARAEVLYDVLQDQRLHTVFGQSLGEKVDEYIVKLKEFRRKFEIKQNNIFIGRDTDVQDIKRKMDTFRGVSICGIGGQGKSSLARAVCCAFQEQSKWAIAMVDLRNKSSTEDVLKAILQAVDQPHGIYGGQNELMNNLKEFLYNLDYDSHLNIFVDKDLIVCLDDCDHVRGNKGIFLKFLYQILSIIDCDEPQKAKFRLLMTTREKQMTENVEPKLGTLFVEHELKPLEEEDAADLLKKCSDVEEMLHEEAIEIVRKCACSPLAVTVVSELLKSRKFTPERLIIHLNVDERNISKGIGVNKCIKEAIDNLDPIHQEVLVCLSVFQSSPFYIHGAHKVSTLGDSKKVTEALQRLHNCHLLDVNDKMSGSKHKQYSLHPLVYQFITEWTKGKELDSTYNTAVQNFVDLYENTVSDVVKKMDSTYWKGRKKLEQHKTHIIKFYDIVADSPKMLKPHPKRLSRKDFIRKKRVSDLADLLLSNVKKRRLFQSESERAKKSGNDAAYIFWKVEEADVFLMLHDSVVLAMEILDNMTEGKFAALRKLHPDPFYPSMVHGLFHKVKGLCRWKQLRYKEGLEHLQLAINFYDKDNQSESLESAYKSLKAKILCYMAQIYIDLDDLETADDMLRKGFEQIKEMVNTRSGESDSDELQKELHWNLPVYYYHFAVIKIRKSKNMSDRNQKDHLLDRAMEDLKKGMALDEKLKLDYLDNYYSKMKAQADIYMMKGMLQQALKHAEFVLDKRREILQPPHFNYTVSVYQVAKVYMLMGEEFKRQDEPDKANDYWITSSDYFKEMSDHHLKDGSIPLTHRVYKEIKDDHIEVVRRTGTDAEVKKMTLFYQRLETGDFDSVAKSRVKDVKKMMWTPFEMVKKYFTGTGAESDEFGARDREVQRFEDMQEDQRRRMIAGEPSGGITRRDSGMGHSSSDLGSMGSISSGSGSLSQQMGRVTLQQSMSLEDNVFTGSGEVQKPVDEGRKPSKKRMKTDSK